MSHLLKFFQPSLSPHFPLLHRHPLDFFFFFLHLGLGLFGWRERVVYNAIRGVELDIDMICCVVYEWIC